MTAKRFNGQVAIVTGAGAGIGRAIAQQWVIEGGGLLIVDWDCGALESCGEQLRSLGARCSELCVDVSEPNSAQVAVEQCLRELGRVDALFNIAGVNLHKNVVEMSYSEWASVIKTNLDAVFLFSKAVLPIFRGQQTGVIVNMASTAGILAENRCAAYSASKAAVILLTRNMAMDFAKDGIRVNALCPGGTRSVRADAYLAGAPPGTLDKLVHAVPMRRLAEPAEVARAALFLASNDDARFITGASLVIDGGMTAGVRFEFFED
jgi:NAD(P)-dependent dehydrogenase (short-subunit alcohol dehydrogenase family)